MRTTIDDGSPPCARGRPSVEPSAFQAAAVHPRVHGEDSGRALVQVLSTRFTPVCTGKTRQNVRCTWITPVHPRVHGED